MTTLAKNQIAAGLFALLGATLTWEAFSYSYASSFFLRALALTLLALALVFSVQTILQRRSGADDETQERDTEEPDTEEREDAGLLIALHVFVLTAGYAAAMSVFGFLLPTFAFVLLGQWTFSRQFRWRHVIYAASLSAFIFILFFGLLGATAPQSPLSVDNLFLLV